MQTFRHYARTLLKSKQGKLFFIDVPPGKYYHVGVESSLNEFLLELKSQGIPIPNQLDLFINADGLPLSASSSSEFWPILFRVVGECIYRTIYTPDNHLT